MKTDDRCSADVERLDQVAIAAAVAVVLGRPATVRAVRAAPGRRKGAWVREGRLSIQTSHRVSEPLVRLVPRA